MFQTFLRATEFGSSATSSIIDCGASTGTVGTIAGLVLAEPAAIIGGAVGAAFGASEDVLSAVASTMGQTFSRTGEFGNSAASSVIDCGAAAGTIGTIAGLVMAEPAAIIGGAVGAAFGASEDASSAVDSNVGQTLSRTSEFGNSAASAVIDCCASTGTLGTIAGLVLAEPAAIIGGAVGAAYGANEDAASTVGVAYGASEGMVSTVASSVGQAFSRTAEFGNNVASMMIEHGTAVSTVWTICFLVLAVPIAIIGSATKAVHDVSKTAAAIIKLAEAALACGTRLAQNRDADENDDDDENADLARGFKLAWKWAWLML